MGQREISNFLRQWKKRLSLATFLQGSIVEVSKNPPRVLLFEWVELESSRKQKRGCFHFLANWRFSAPTFSKVMADCALPRKAHRLFRLQLQDKAVNQKGRSESGLQRMNILRGGVTNELTFPKSHMSSKEKKRKKTEKYNVLPTVFSTKLNYYVSNSPYFLLSFPGALKHVSTAAAIKNPLSLEKTLYFVPTTAQKKETQR